MKIISVTSRSVSIKINNDMKYYNLGYKLYLNNEFLYEEFRNVFTIFDLEPNTSYELKINNNILKFKTLDESVVLNVLDFNACGDGISDDTTKIQAVIMCAPNNGCVYIPKGVYLVTSLFLKSNMTLYFEDGALLLGKNERTHYPILPGIVGDYNFGVWEGSEVSNFSSILNFINVCNVTICGKGIIDCDAENGDWYHNHRVKNIAWRGHAIFTNRSNDISFIGLSVKNTFSWAIHPYFSNNIDFINININNNKDMPTTDGIDPDCSSNISILGCVFDVGDDCIAIKSGTIDLAKKYNKSSSNIIINNNLMKNGHGGVVFGSESSGGINNVRVTNCLFQDTDRGLRIKTRRGRGNIGSIDNVIFDNILMENVKTPFVINMYYNMGPPGGHIEYVWTTKKLSFDSNTPVIGKFKFSNMICNDVSYAAGVFLGLPESNIGEVYLDNIVFNYKECVEEGYPVMIEHNFKMKKQGLYCFNVNSIKTNNVIFNGNDGDNIIREVSE